jgi:phospholipid N-methyltransferase
MNGNELAERRTGVTLKRRIAQAVGPAGVFFRGFLEHPRMVGSIIASSRHTIDKMLAPVKWNECKLFVEYGPGVGTFCRPVLDRLPRDGALLVIDTNPLFIDYLTRTIRDSRFHPVLGSAEDVEAIVAALGYEKADYVLSGLPFSTLPEGVGPAIAAATHRVVRRGGAFMTYQFRASARDLTARYFKRIETAFAWWNVPPCLLCWGWQTD